MSLCLFGFHARFWKSEIILCVRPQEKTLMNCFLYVLPFLSLLFGGIQVYGEVRWDAVKQACDSHNLEIISSEASNLK